MNRLEIEVVCAQKLSDEMKAEYGIDASDDSHFMIVKHNGEIIYVIGDYMEPEDATFLRDLSWIPELLDEVYMLGKGDQDV